MGPTPTKRAPVECVIALRAKIFNGYLNKCAPIEILVIARKR